MSNSTDGLLALHARWTSRLAKLHPESLEARRISDMAYGVFLALVARDEHELVDRFFELSTGIPEGLPE